MEALRRPGVKGIRKSDPEIRISVLFYFVHLSLNLFDCESVHQLDGFANLGRGFLRRCGLADMYLKFHVNNEQFYIGLVHLPQEHQSHRYLSIVWTRALEGRH
jgi:hypothetical protein